MLCLDILLFILPTPSLTPCCTVDTLKPSTDSDSEYFAVKRRKLLVGTAAEAALTDASPAQPDASVIQRRASDELRWVSFRRHVWHFVMFAVAVLCMMQVVSGNGWLVSMP